MLDGFHTMDEHFRTADFAQNVPVIMGLLNVWYNNFYGTGSHAVLPYSQYLLRFPAYLQQLTMESNGKSVRVDGSPVSQSAGGFEVQTGEIFWGEPGTNGQHAFYQLLHQGTKMTPADFIAFAQPNHDLGTMHDLFMSNFFAQTAALAFGKTADEVRAEGTAEAIVAHRVMPGNRPTNSILAERLTPSVLGQLVALYEHITFTQSILWGINAFDQWGVELGKQMALQFEGMLTSQETPDYTADGSTNALIAKYRELRGRA
jgi:glucose-6-phosphate isomerase